MKEWSIGNHKIFFEYYPRFFGFGVRWLHRDVFHSDVDDIEINFGPLTVIIWVRHKP